MNSRLMIGSVLGVAALASAHLGALTEPKAGSTYQAGASVTVKWTVPTAHNTIDLSISQDGSTWTSVTTGLARTVTSFAWTVPNQPSATTRFRVCQRDGTNVTGCTNSHNTQSLGQGITVPGGEVYTAITGNFTITGGSGVADAAEAAGQPRLSFDAASRNVGISFRLEQAGQVLLEAFDAQGRLLAVLLDERMAAGDHMRSVFSNRLPAGAFVLRLQAGTRAIQHAVGAGR